MGEIMLCGWLLVLYAPTVRYQPAEDMERIQDYIPARLSYHPALDDAVDGILGFLVELGEIVNRPVNLHVLHEDMRQGFHLRHLAVAGVQFIFVVSENLFQILPEIMLFLFHGRNA